MKNYAMAAVTLALLGTGLPQLAHANCSEMSAQDRAKHLDQMAADLKLTPDQKKQVETIKSTKYDKIDAAEKDARDQIRAVLNLEQQTKYDKMMEKKAKK